MFLADSDLQKLTGRVRSAAQARWLRAHGHRDSFEFKIVTADEAQRIRAHERATNRGTA